MIKFGVVSDIHSEFWQQSDLTKIGGMIKKEVAEADILLLAGDIGSGPQAVKMANHLWSDKPVCIVAGNHEYYNNIVDDVIHGMSQMSRAVKNVHFLNRGVYVNNDFEKPVRVIGATLWTDYDLYGTQHISMIHAAKNLNDFYCIFKSIQQDLIKPDEVLQWHIRDRDWIQQEMDKPFDGFTVVMTHHAPVSFAEHPQFINGVNSPCFISKLDNMFTRDDLDLVVWGHTHHSVDKTFCNTRFVSNQVGYLSTPYGFYQGVNGKISETGDFGTIVEL
jgi:predicted phosphodiesterase